MLEIIVCDDDRFMLNYSVEIIDDCISRNKFSAKIVCKTQNTSEVILFLEKNPASYLYFLDLDFGTDNLNGVDIARRIKLMEPLSKIVFVTSHSDAGIKILKSGVEAFGFIEKSASKGDMLLAYRKYIDLAAKQGFAPVEHEEINEKVVNLPVGIDEYVSIPVSQILYVTSAKTISHFICYYTVDGSSISVRDTIENALDMLGEDFVKSHRSVIVNKKQITSVADGCVKFAGGETVACSSRLKKEILKFCKAGEQA